jgi:hypothetical protein
MKGTPLVLYYTHTSVVLSKKKKKITLALCVKCKLSNVGRLGFFQFTHKATAFQQEQT